MSQTHDTTLLRLLDQVAGPARCQRLMDVLEVPQALHLPPIDGQVHRTELAQALIMLLFEDILRRVPPAAAYVEDARREGRRLLLDHGALRTVAGDCGALPAGHRAVSRILAPLGYEERDTYPLTSLAMTGRAFTHRDLPEEIAQFFVSELHPEQFSARFQAATTRVVGNSRDPLSPRAQEDLARLTKDHGLPFRDAAHLLPDLVGCFDRHHPEPTWSDYQLLLAESSEMAWIATEGNAFNHATDRVADVEAVAAQQRRLGRPIKDRVEISASGRVRQTAFRASPVERRFLAGDGSILTATVPGSFHEFISRDQECPGVLDLRFDAANATGIFKMTAPSAPVPGRIQA